MKRRKLQLKGRKQGYSHIMCHLNLKKFFFNFEIITDSQEAANITKAVLDMFTQFSPMVTSYITMAQCQNQEINIDTTYRPYSDFASFNT